MKTLTNIAIICLFFATAQAADRSAGECLLLSSIDRLADESISKDIAMPKLGRPMILLGLYMKPQGDGILVFEMAQRLSKILTTRESEAIGFRLTRKVLTYGNFPDAFPVAGLPTLPRILKSVDSAIEQGGDSRVIWVNLDGFNVHEAFYQVGDKMQPANYVFSSELAHLLRPGVINKVRWLKGGNEIEAPKAKGLFEPYFQDLDF